MKKFKKIFFVTFSFIVIISTFIVGVFADNIQEGQSQYITTNNPVIMNTQNPTIDYTVSTQGSVFNVTIRDKTSGSWGIYQSTYDLVGNIEVPFQIDFKIAYSPTYMRNRVGPRMYIWYGRGGSGYNQGFSISFSDSGISTSCVSSYTIVANTGSSIDWWDNWYDEYDADEMWNFRIVINPSLSKAELYVIPYGRDSILLNSAIIDYFDYTIFGLGMWDSVPHNMLDYPTGSYIGVYQPYITNLGIGYQIGYNTGYEVGYNNGIDVGEGIGFSDGYDEGYADGITQGGTSEIDVPSVVDSIVQAPVTIFTNIFGFELFGINISALIGSILVVCLIVWLIRKLVR